MNISYNSNTESNVQSNGTYEARMSSDLLMMLSKGVYEDIIQSPVREVISNAIDACKSTGKGYTVTLPTEENPIFAVEDFGCGMDADQLKQVYFTYGASTKSADNNQIGGLGIGAKSPYAYTSSFEVASSKNGKKLSYLSYIDEHSKPSYTFLGESECDTTGTRVAFAVKSEDFKVFWLATLKVLLTASQMPTSINIPDDKLFSEFSTTAEEFAEMREAYKGNIVRLHKVSCPIYDDGIFVEMAGVLYKVSKAQIFSKSSYDDIYDFFGGTRMAIILHFENGEVSFQISRENLNYDAGTIAKVECAYLQVCADLVTDLFAEKTAYAYRRLNTSDFSRATKRLIHLINSANNAAA